MLDKMKNLGAKAGDAIEGMMRESVDSLANAASSATGNLNEKAVRASTSQVCRILEIAIEELNGRPLANRPISLTASVNIGIAALEMQVHLHGQAPAMTLDIGDIANAEPEPSVE